MDSQIQEGSCSSQHRHFIYPPRALGQTIGPVSKGAPSVDSLPPPPSASFLAGVPSASERSRVRFFLHPYQRKVLGFGTPSVFAKDIRHFQTNSFLVASLCKKTPMFHSASLQKKKKSGDFPLAAPSQHRTRKPSPGPGSGFICTS